MESRIYDLQPETDIFRCLYMDNIAESINWGDMVEVFGAVDEDRRVRVGLADELQETVDRVGAYLDAQIVYASKSGYSWLAEYVIPRLRGLRPHRVIIQAKGGESPRTTENSNTSRNNILPAVPEELDGIGAVIANGLRLKPEDVVFERYEGKADWTYVCLSENSRGVRTNAGAFKARFSERKAEDGAAAPRTTGYIQVFVNNDKILDRSIKTEAEQAWELYADEILPEFIALYGGDKDGTGGGIGACAALRVELALGTSGVTLVDDELSKRTLAELCERMLAYGDGYLREQGFDFGGRTAEEAGALSIAVVEYMGKPQVRVSMQSLADADA